MKPFYLISLICLFSVSVFCQETKKLSLVFSGGINHNDINLGDEYTTDRLFSRVTSRATPNFGALVNFKSGQLLSIEGGVYFVSQKVGMKNFVYFTEKGNYFFEGNLNSFTSDLAFTGEIKAKSYIVPVRASLLLNPKKGKIKTSIVFGLLKQFNYNYKETYEVTANLISVNGEKPSSNETDLNNYIRERLSKERAPLDAKPMNSSEKINNLGFLIGLKVNLYKNFELELNKHFIEIRPKIGYVYNYNFSSLNLRYSFGILSTPR